MSNSPLLRELRAKKAKFGFECNLSLASIEKLGPAITLIKNHDPSIYMEMPNNMGHASVKIYTDNPDTAEFIRKVSNGV